MIDNYGNFLSVLKVKAIADNFASGNYFVGLFFKLYLMIFGYPDIGGAVRFPKVRSRLDIHPEEMMLDIGCGRGFYSLYCAASGARVTAVDDGPFVEVAQNLAEELRLPVRIIRGDISKIGEHLPDQENYDKILAIEVLEHIVDDKNAFRDWCRLLKPGGTMIFSVPLATDEENNNFQPDLIGDPYGHKRAGYTLDSIQNLCVDNKMKIMEYEAYCRDENEMVISKNAFYYKNNKLMHTLLSFPVWKKKWDLEKTSNSAIAGFHAIILTLEKVV